MSKRTSWIRNEQRERSGIYARTLGEVFDLATDPSESVDLAGRGDHAVLAAIDRFDALFSEAGLLARLAAQLEVGAAPAPLTAAQGACSRRFGYPAERSATPPRLPPGTKLSQVLPLGPRFPREP